jgi:hypothetical protein
MPSARCRTGEPAVRDPASIRSLVPAGFFSALAQARQDPGVLDLHCLQRLGVESEQRQDRRGNLNDPHPGTDGRAVPQAGPNHQDRHAEVLETSAAMLSDVGRVA